MGFTLCRGGDTRSQRAAQRVVDIQHAACTLVLERGYDGFTMDDLAERVGVSRRTLFNHVPDKASAVIGPFDESGLDDESLLLFRDGGPHGRLFDDLVHAIDTVVERTTDIASSAHHALVNRAITSDPKVLHLVAHRFEVIAAFLEDAVTAREGWPANDLRARTLAATVLGLIKVTLDDLAGADDDVDFTARFHEVLAADAAVRAQH